MCVCPLLQHLCMCVEHVHAFSTQTHTEKYRNTSSKVIKALQQETLHQSSLCRHEVIIPTVAQSPAAHLVTHVHWVVWNNEQ